ncbi:hypothetical protein GZ77_09460 [Endozoicomonas montiporae]|uniref:Uncharacterized protein n=2 Tax=Endozoicomonas montiporae TaxID=1027273 RepID=A0A081N7X2_9GAMM|nr:hypothetical protein [Endozoicomonas montiporae]AMO55584.1 hypothetical protein EZMO1_1396 [Endozoicomonas montiporae CL-33]KEQ14545.1 hypothetical protein GZ77_09435 [Endozoicomonas montiporae]KEQ14549.1 hypothetical protein GZ77_09460 [Endozoicomonas montiporae]
MKEYNSENEIYLVVLNRQSGDCPKICKAYNNQFFEDLQQAWDLAQDLNHEHRTSKGIDNDLWTVVNFHGQITNEFESQEDVIKFLDT